MLQTLYHPLHPLSLEWAETIVDSNWPRGRLFCCPRHSGSSPENGLEGILLEVLNLIIITHVSVVEDAVSRPHHEAVGGKRNLRYANARGKSLLVLRDESVLDTAVEEGGSDHDARRTGKLLGTLHKALADPIETAAIGRIEAPAAVVDAVESRWQFVAQSQVDGETGRHPEIILNEEVPVGTESVQIIHAQRVRTGKAAGSLSSRSAIALPRPRPGYPVAHPLQFAVYSPFA